MNQRNEPSPGWRDVVRRILSTVMMVVGLLAVIATSPPFSELLEEHQGVSFDIAPGDEVRLPFEFEVSDAARGGDSWGVSFEFSVVWREVDSAEQTLEITVVDGHGEMVTGQSGSDNLRLSCRDECLGGGEVVIRWPPHLDRGEATVDWKASAAATFDADSPPEGAMILFTISDPPVASQSRVLATGLLSSTIGERQVVLRQRVEISANDPTGDYWLEVPEFATGYAPGAAFYVISNEVRTHLDEAGSIPVVPPPGCGSPCTWSIDLVLVEESYRYDNVVSVSWRVTQVGGSQPATAESSDVPASSIVTHLDGGPVALTGDERFSIPVRLTVEPEAVTIGDFDVHAPQVLLTLHATVDETATDFSSEGRLEVQIGGLVNPYNENIDGRSGPLYDNTFRDRRPVVTPAKLNCDDDVCSVEFQLAFETVNFGSGEVSLIWDLTAELFYPFAITVPAGAGMSLSQD